jgi:hypothetical protein
MEGVEMGKPAWVTRTAAVAASGALLAATSAFAEDDAERVRRAVAHTISTQLSNGLFEYDFDFLAGKPTGKDNIVRQAGTLFVLGEYLVDTGDPDVVPVMRKGLDAMAERSLPIGKGTPQRVVEWLGGFSIKSWRLERAYDRMGILYDPTGDGLVIADAETYETAYAGATALALIAELSYFRATRDDRYGELRGNWARGLLSLHVPGRGIRRHPATLTQGPYVNGQAWLALAYYHQTFPDDTTVDHALQDLEDYVIERYTSAPDRLFYHWGAIASAARLPTGDSERLAEFAAQQTEFILDKRPPETPLENSTCSLIEGLASAAAVLGSRLGREDLAARIRERVAVELSLNRALQIRPQQERVELGAGALLTAPTLAQYDGAFLAGRYHVYTRTDLTQHCISALLKVRRHGLQGAVSP